MKNNLEWNNYGLKYSAQVGDLYVEGYGQKKCIYKGNKKIINLVWPNIILEDGSQAVAPPEFIDPALCYHAFYNQLQSNLKAAKDKYLAAVANIPMDKTTVDGLNLKQLMTNISHYVDSNFHEPTMRIHTYQKLTEMLENPSNAADIAKEGIDSKVYSNTGKDLALAILLLVAAAALIGVGVALVALPFITGMLYLASLVWIAAGMIIGGGYLGIAALDEISQANQNHQHNKNVKNSFDSAFHFYSNQENSEAKADYSINGDINDLAPFLENKK